MLLETLAEPPLIQSNGSADSGGVDGAGAVGELSDVIQSSESVAGNEVESGFSQSLTPSVEALEESGVSDDNQSNEAGAVGVDKGSGLGGEGDNQSDETVGATDSAAGADNPDNQSEPAESLDASVVDDDSQSGEACGVGDAAVGADTSDNQLGDSASLDASVVGADSQSSEVSGTADSVVGDVDSDNQSGNTESGDDGVTGIAEADSIPVPFIQSGTSESDSLCGVSHDG